MAGARKFPDRILYFLIMLFALAALWAFWDVAPKPAQPVLVPVDDVEPPRELTADDQTTLLNSYAPILVLAFGENWRPVAVERFLDDACVSQREAKRWTPCKSIGGVKPNDLPRGSGKRLDLQTCVVKEGPECYENDAFTQSSAPPTIYGRVWTNTSGRHPSVGYTVQYWLFYYFDDWQNALEDPTLWQFHEGDWEEVSVGLTRTLEPLYVAGSEHCTGRFRFWDDVEIRRKTHPTIYVARGSHANFFSRTAYPTPMGCLPTIIRPIARQLRSADETGAGVTLGDEGKPQITVVPLEAVKWQAFQGPWGEGEFVRWETRSGRRRVHAGGSSPNSPTQKGLAWRNPVEETFYRWPQDPTPRDWELVRPARR